MQKKAKTRLACIAYHSLFLCIFWENSRPRKKIRFAPPPECTATKRIPAQPHPNHRARGGKSSHHSAFSIITSINELDQCLKKSIEVEQRFILIELITVKNKSKLNQINELKSFNARMYPFSLSLREDLKIVLPHGLISLKHFFFQKKTGNRP